MLIEHRHQCLQLAFAEAQQRPGRFASQKVRACQQGTEQVRRTQVFITVQRRTQPGVLDQFLQLAAQLRFALHSARQRVEVVEQPSPECVHVPFVAACDERQVALTLLQQLE